MKKYLGILAIGVGSVLFSEGLEHGVILIAIGLIVLLLGIYLVSQKCAELASKTSQQAKE
ncbi:MAG: hypothetical protein KKF26_05475 [Chloroflexi bacterium]|nr:hypothetical protein [Chloroflexota bacterium]